MGSRRAWEEEEEEGEDLDFGGAQPGRRATLLESEAEELRERLDTLLAELGRHRRLDPAALIQRPAVIAAVAVTAVAITVAVMWWRQYGRSAA
jgi:hypothetical protein